MKSLLITIALLLLTSFTHISAQNNIKNNENQKIVTHVIGSHYDVVMYTTTGEIVQEGHYFKEGDRFLENGIWKLYDHNTHELVTKARYDKGEQIWVETWIDGELIRVNKKEKEVIRLNTTVAQLEKNLAEIDYIDINKLNGGSK